MSGMRLGGDWERAGVALKMLQMRLLPVAEVTLYENGQLILNRLREHIDRQDLSWTPLSETTVRLKGGDDTIYVETGGLREELDVRYIKAGSGDRKIFVGASPWKTHKESGLKFSDLMVYLEYGTDKIPARPLIRPTWNELEPEIKKVWSNVLKELMRG